LPFSAALLKKREAKNAAALDRIALAEARIRNILERETISHQKTLEQKISEQGPQPMRVDPHLVGLALMDLVERELIAEHKSSGVQNWFSHRLERPDKIKEAIEKKVRSTRKYPQDRFQTSLVTRLR
jgi:hypothetical protein